MIPFQITLKLGSPISEQIRFAVQRAVVTGTLKPGDAFPSVRALSQELRINPNTAHKVVAQLIQEGLLAAKPGVGTVVQLPPHAKEEDRSKLISGSLERLVVEARRMGIGRSELVDELKSCWDRLNSEK